MKNWFLCPLALFALSSVQAQCNFMNGQSSTSQGSSVLNGSYVASTLPTRKVVGYSSLVERDVMWSKRVWRIIDLREKMNHPMYFPLEPTHNRASLWDIIRCSVESGNLTAYNPGPVLEDDEFTLAYSPMEISNIITTWDTTWTASLEDEDELIMVVQPESIETYNIKKYMLKEDWFFDKQRSVMDVRIVGIAPMREVLGEDGDLRGYAPVFWLYFPELRYTLANVKVFNRQNNAANMSYDDLFFKRMFASYIIKESNVFDRSINSYSAGQATLFESEEIKRDISRYEQDLWHY